MRIRGFACLLLFVYGAVASAQAQVAADAQVADQASIDGLRSRIRALVESRLEDHPAPGLAVTMIHDGRVQWFESFGYADRRARTPITPRTCFALCSISKSVAAWLMMRAVERRELALDEPVVPRLEVWRPRRFKEHAQGITLRRLLSHTAGLNVHGVGGMAISRKLPALADALLGRAPGSRRVDLIRKPGEAWQYSGGGFGLAQRLFELETGRAFTEAVETEILRPLDMHASGYHWSNEQRANSATPYLPSGRATKRLNYALTAGAGFVSNSEDFARFVIACMPGHRSAEAEKVLSTDSIRAMIEAAPNAPHYGLGFARKPIEGVLTFGHTGGDYGWTTVFRVQPRLGDGLIVLQNCFQAEPLSREIEALWAAWVRATILASQQTER